MATDKIAVAMNLFISGITLANAADRRWPAASFKESVAVNDAH
jgi:hypothetical protein